MSFLKIQKLAILTLVYWFLLLYMVAALIFWFIALERQNAEITDIKLNSLNRNDPAYSYKEASFQANRKRKTAQYIGEGSTFLALIAVGAIFVFRATRRQLIFSQQQQNFMMAITHELKTPIAITQLNLETLQKRKLDDERQQKLIADTLQEANRLNTLCNNILLASQLDAGAYTQAKQEINFSDLVEGCLDDFKMRFPARAIPENIEQGVYLIGETLLLQILVNNLIENALKYSPKASPVSIVLYEEHGRISLRVTDEGMSIPDHEKKKIFDKFYRIGNENTRKSKGTGLGLYLCRKIVQSHNGRICVTDNQPAGNNFIVTFKVV